MELEQLTADTIAENYKKKMDRKPKKNYDDMDFVLDFNLFEDLELFKMKKKNQGYNMKARIKSYIDQEERDFNTNAPITQNASHMLYYIAKFWYNKYKYFNTNTPELCDKIKRLERKCEILNNRCNRLQGILDDLEYEPPIQKEHKLNEILRVNYS